MPQCRGGGSAAAATAGTADARLTNAGTDGTAEAGPPNAAVAAPPVSATSVKETTQPVSAAATSVEGAAAIAGAMPRVPEVNNQQLSDTEVPPVLDDKMVRLAAALRHRYRRPGGLVRIPVESVGFHPMNRDGQPPNGSRCGELFKEIFDVGFDAEESDNGGIVVEAKPGSIVLHDFNKNACDGDPVHVPVVTGLICYGSLSHSHLHQILRNIRGGGACLVQEVSESGKFSLVKLKSVDPAFGHAAETGLLWDILSWAIEVEEPNGCAIIQAAMNSKNSIFLLRHEMQALAALVDYTYASAVAERALSLDAAKRRLKLTCPEFAVDKDFLELYRYVIDLGSGVAGFLPDLRAFHERFVDPKLRRVRLSGFAIMNMLPVDMPYLKVAGMKFQYACDPKQVHSGFCEALSSKAVREVVSNPTLKAVAVDAEQLLDFFHRRCWPADRVEGVLPAVAGSAVAAGNGSAVKANRLKFLCNLDKDVFGIVAGSLPDASRRPSLLEACGRAYLRMRQTFPEVSFPSFPHALPNPAVAVAESTPKLSPKVILYVNGKPVTTQDSIVKGPSLEVYDWASHMETAEVSSLSTCHAARSAIICAVEVLRQHTRCSRDDVHVLRGGNDAGGVHVVAARLLRKGELTIAPLVRQHTQLMKECTQGWAPAVKVTRDNGEVTTLFMCVSPSLPPKTHVAVLRSVEEWDAAASAVAANAMPRFCDHQWKDHHCMWPFWVVRRSVIGAGTNCKLHWVTMNTVHTGSDKSIMPEAVVKAYDVTLPVLINTEDIRKGDDLVCHWPVADTAPKDKRPKYKVSTWASEAKRQKT